MINRQYTREEEIEFNTRMKKFRDEGFKVQLGEDGIWSVVCKHGDIESYSKTEMCFYGSFRSARGGNSILGKLPDYCQITQVGGGEFVFKFPNGRFYDIANLVNAKRKKILSQERIEALRVHAIQIRKKRLKVA